MNGSWQHVLQSGSLAILAGSCTMLPFDALRAHADRVHAGRALEEVALRSFSKTQLWSFLTNLIFLPSPSPFRKPSNWS